MAYEKSKFGFAGGPTTVSSPLVSTHYGPREVGGTVGVPNTVGFMNELVIDFTGATVNAAAFPLIPPSFPAGANIEDAFLEVQEVFALGGTTPAVEVGTEGTEAVNGVTLSEAQLEALGTYDVTPEISGTWGTSFATETVVGIALSGTTPTITNAGKARLVIRYIKP